MAETTINKDLIIEKIHRFAKSLEEHKLKVWRMYLFGSYAKGTVHKYSDIDVAVFLDQDDIDGFDEEVMMRKLRRGIDLDIEPHAFARTDFDETDPFVGEIVRTGERII